MLGEDMNAQSGNVYMLVFSSNEWKGDPNGDEDAAERYGHVLIEGSMEDANGDSIIFARNLLDSVLDG